MIDDNTMMMQPDTGAVQTRRDWRIDWAQMPEEMWGGPRFEDAGLIPVVWDETTQYWVEAE